MRFISMVWMRINGRERFPIQAEAMTTADFARSEGNGAVQGHYRSENANSRYRSNEKVEAITVMVRSQSRQVADSVEYPYGEKTDDNNPAGFYLKDHVRTITGR
mgnify:CR=1 FL=1